jgi:hypothetical protein
MKKLSQILLDVVRKFQVSYVKKLELSENYDGLILSIYA